MKVLDVLKKLARATAVTCAIGMFAGSALAQTGRTDPVEGPDPFSHANELREGGRLEEALEAYTAYIKEHPKSGAAYELRSAVLGELKRYEESLDDSELALAYLTIPRDRARTAYAKCQSLIILNRVGEAALACVESAKFDPTYAMAFVGLGKIAVGADLWEKAAMALDRAIELDPTISAAWTYRALTHLQQGNRRDALVAAEKAVELDPNDLRALEVRAVSYGLNGRFQEMLDDATRVVEFEPPMAGAHLLRGKAFAFLGRFDEAIAEFEAEPAREAAEAAIADVRKQLTSARSDKPVGPVVVQ